jgi:hypothetical protein
MSISPPVQVTTICSKSDQQDIAADEIREILQRAKADQTSPETSDDEKI